MNRFKQHTSSKIKKFFLRVLKKKKVFSLHAKKKDCFSFLMSFFSRWEKKMVKQFFWTRRLFNSNVYLPAKCSLTGETLSRIDCHASTAACDIKSISLRSPQNFVFAMLFHGLRRGYMITPGLTDDEKNNVEPLSQVSHPLFNEFREHAKPAIKKGHESVFFEVGRRTNCLFMIALWNTTRGSGSGGVRYTTYESVNDQLMDTLRLAEGMGRKNALAGLWYGGGKGTIAERKNDSCLNNDIWRENVFKDWGEFVASLQGAYITAEDVGCTVKDMETIHSKTRFVNCIPEHMGGSGNPSHMTARGVLCAIEAACNERGTNVCAARFAVQGLGNVGTCLIEELLKKNVPYIIATDTDPEKVQAAKDRFANNKKFSTNGGKKLYFYLSMGALDYSILHQQVDVLALCALGGQLNAQSIPNIQASIVCGAANNQLQNPETDGKLLFCRGITYVPDFIANRMGIVNCANEHAGKVGVDPLKDLVILKHLSWEKTAVSIYHQTRSVLFESVMKNMPTNEIANQFADTACATLHPIFPNRAREIQFALVKEGHWLRAGEIVNGTQSSPKL